MTIPEVEPLPSSPNSFSVIGHINNYDTQIIHDPHAKPSERVRRSKLLQNQEGDGDVWIETVFRSSKSGKTCTFFISQNTGRRVRDEPPTGASQVLYLRNLIRKTLETS